MTGNRKRIQHYHEPGDLHELTFSCYSRLPLLNDDATRILLSQSIDRAISHHAFGLVAFVLMPEHVHLLVSTLAANPKIDALLFAIKRPFSFRIKQHYGSIGSRWRTRLVVRERPGKLAFRFWEEGAGYDRNLSQSATIVGSIEYIHMNPVRRGLVERARDWKWSSCRWYESNKEVNDPDLSAIHGLPDALD